MVLSSGNLRVAIPSDGAMYEPSLLFLDACGLRVNRINSRRYVADIPFLPGVDVLFQRSSDITSKVEDGTADLGLIGYDRYLEMRNEDGPSNVLMNTLGFGGCSLSLGIPDSWIDVSSIADLADIAVDFKNKGNSLRIATKSPRLVERFLLSNGISNFSIVESSGTLEVAPAMGFADIIADITSSGTTMRENHLKTIAGGTVIESEACLIANARLPMDSPVKNKIAEMFVKIVRAHLDSKEFFSVTANIQGTSVDAVADLFSEFESLSGLNGATVSPVLSNSEVDYFASTVVVARNTLMQAVSDLESIGAKSVTVSQLNYVFQSSEMRNRIS
mgnify:FL=1